MEIRQFNELNAARRGYAFLTATPTPPPLASLPAPMTQQIQTLGTTIAAIDVQASAQTAARGAITDRSAAAVEAAKELRAGHLVPLKKVAKLLVKGATGATLSPEFASAITVPHSRNYEALLAATTAAVQTVTPYKDLFVARGLPTDFLEQMTDQATALSQGVVATGAAKGARATTTRELLQLMHELRSTLHVLGLGVTKACRADRASGPTTLAGWRSAVAIRKAPTPTDIPFVPPASATAPSTSTATAGEAAAAGIASSNNH